MNIVQLFKSLSSDDKKNIVNIDTKRTSTSHQIYLKSVNT
jgi:hypothetical protein